MRAAKFTDRTKHVPKLYRVEYVVEKAVQIAIGQVLKDT